MESPSPNLPAASSASQTRPASFPSKPTGSSLLHSSLLLHTASLRNSSAHDSRDLALPRDLTPDTRAAATSGELADSSEDEDEFYDTAKRDEQAKKTREMERERWRLSVLWEESRRVDQERRAREVKMREEARAEELRRREEEDRRRGGGDMPAPARKEEAFSSRHDFTSARQGTPTGTATGGEDILSSRPREESYLSYSYRTGRERLSLHESAPGSRWPGRLSGERNCGFAGGLKRGLRRDAVNELDEGGRRRRRVIPVPAGLHRAMLAARKTNEEGKEGVGDWEEGDEDAWFSAEEGIDEDEAENEDEAVDDDHAWPYQHHIPILRSRDSALSTSGSTTHPPIRPLSKAFSPGPAGQDRMLDSFMEASTSPDEEDRKEMAEWIRWASNAPATGFLQYPEFSCT